MNKFPIKDHFNELHRMSQVSCGQMVLSAERKPEIGPFHASPDFKSRELMIRQNFLHGVS